MRAFSLFCFGSLGKTHLVRLLRLGVMPGTERGRPGSRKRDVGIHFSPTTNAAGRKSVCGHGRCSEKPLPDVRVHQVLLLARSERDTARKTEIGDGFHSLPYMGKLLPVVEERTKGEIPRRSSSENHPPFFAVGCDALKNGGKKTTGRQSVTMAKQP